MTDPAKPPLSENEPIPTAVVRPRVRNVGEWLAATRLWWLTLVCLIVAVALVFFSLRPGGPEIVVHFRDGHGIKVGDRLQFRGIEVGTVTAVELTDELQQVAVRIELQPEAADVAREGSQFWVERPELSLSRLRGLETVVGAKYLSVSPGPPDAPPAFEFVGLETMPVLRSSEGAEIIVRFREGHGLGIGDVVQHRGIVVGEVTAVELDEAFTGVVVQVRLVGSARKLAREGTQFWVERPRVSVTEIRGLDTLVRGQYLALRPGPPDAEPVFAFDGLESAPPGELPPGGLEIVLEGPRRFGLEPGAPVAFRGHRIGHIVSVGLATDAATVEVRAFIDPDFRQLVRTDTRFWSNSGFDVRIGFSGVQVSAETLATIAAGGVSLATPEEFGEPATTGRRFRLHEEPDAAWLEWQPRIPTGGSLLPEGMSLPTPTRVTLRWTNTFVIGWTKRRSGWLLPLADGRLLGPADLMTAVEGSEKNTFLEVAGAEVLVTPKKREVAGSLATFQDDRIKIPPERTWPLDRMRAPERVEECVIVADPQGLKLPVSESRLTGEADSWRLDASLPVNADWHGGSVLSRSDGHLIGVLVIDENGARVVPLPDSLVTARRP